MARGPALSANKQAKASIHLKAEHSRELKSLKERMERLGSWQHRKKNGADPLANPVWFFRGKNRDAAAEKVLSLEHFEKKVRQKYAQDKRGYRLVDDVVAGLKGGRDLATDINYKRAPLYQRPTSAAPGLGRKSSPLDRLKGKKGDLRDSLLYGKGVKKRGLDAKRVTFANSWKRQIVSTEGRANANRDDFQGLSAKIRPANTIYKEREVPDYTKDPDDLDDEEY